MEIKSERTNLDMLQLPEVVYKYREAENPFHLSIVEDAVVYFSPPSGFEDKKDCKLKEGWKDLTDDEIYNYYLKGVKEKHPGETEEQSIARAKEWVAEGLLKNPVRVDKITEEHWQNFDSRFGVLCLTEDNKNPEMWDKYSAKYNGFCVGFNPKIMFPHLGGGGIVEYVDDLPVIHPFDEDDVKHIKQVFSKEKKWAFEKEYRTHKLWPKVASVEDRKIKIPGEAYTELIIGDKVSDDRKEALIKAAKKLNPHIQIKYASEVVGQVNISIV